LALEQFFRSSSLPEMARSAAASVINLREWTSQTLVQLKWPPTKSSSMLPTLFLSHDADGTVWQLIELARQLPFAVVGIQAVTCFSDDDKKESISELNSPVLKSSLDCTGTRFVTGKAKVHTQSVDSRLAVEWPMR
jgi:hypothetical protein